MDMQGLRCFNLLIKWLTAFEGLPRVQLLHKLLSCCRCTVSDWCMLPAAARYYFEHSRVIHSENAVWKKSAVHAHRGSIAA